MCGAAAQLIAFYQVVVVMPEVYGLPPLPSWYDDVMELFTWLGRLDWTHWLPPGACIDYQLRLLLRGLGPLLLLALLPLGFGVREAVYACRERRDGARPRCSPKMALLAALPTLLFVSFLLCPGISASIFSAWGCVPYTVDSEAGTERFFLREDPAVVCSSSLDPHQSKHARITSLALAFVVVWPLGLPLCFVLVLLLCRKSILERRQTALVVATEVLHKE